jgi:hypothetical protein
VKNLTTSMRGRGLHYQPTFMALECLIRNVNRNGKDILEDRMPRIQTLRKYERNMWFDKNGAVDSPEPNHRCNHGLEEFRTTNENVLEFERSASQTLGLFISHDIRNYLASIYCDIEFVSDPDICQTDREQLLAGVRGTKVC